MSERSSSDSARAARSGFALLVRLDLLRVVDSLRHPSGSWIGLGLPAVLLVGLLWAAGPAAVPDVQGAGGAAAFGLLVAGPAAFAAYGTLFGGADSAFLRRLGIAPGDLFRQRAMRLLLVALGWAGLVLIPFASAGLPLGRPVLLALAAALAAWGVGLAALCAAARAVSDRRPGQGGGLMAIGMWDPELAAIAPLVYAPLLPLFAGGLAGGLAGGEAPGGSVALLLVGVGTAAAAAAASRGYARALPRFAPRVLEMTFVAPPSSGGELVVGRGVARLVPRKAAAAWARDSVVAGRRFAWAARIAWPVTLAALVGLARWGEHPATRAWVAAAAVLALLVQGAAILGLGRLERGGRRWVDRSLGIAWPHRLLGRWGWGTGLSFWLTIPLSLAWGWWSGAGAGWPWVLAGAATAGVAAAGSLIVAGWR